MQLSMIVQWKYQFCIKCCFKLLNNYLGMLLISLGKQDNSWVDFKSASPGLLYDFYTVGIVCSLSAM